MEYNEIDNIIHAGVTFVVYLFIMVVLYFALSTPVDAIMDALLNVPLGEATDEMALYNPNISWALKLVFAIGISIPVTWFIFWVFSREPDVSRIRRF